MPRNRRFSVVPSLAVFLFVALFSAACGDDPADPDTADITDFLGTWSWTVLDVTSSCGPEDLWMADVVIARVGTSDTDVTASSRWHADDVGPHVFDGTVSGNTLTIPDVTYTEGGGTLVADHVVTLQNDGRLSGTETWTWTGPGGSCVNGTADVIASPF